MQSQMDCTHNVQEIPLARNASVKEKGEGMREGKKKKLSVGRKLISSMRHEV